MIEERELVERAVRVLQPDAPTFDRLLRRRDRKRRNRRIGTIVVALVIAALALGESLRVLSRIERQMPAVKPPAGTIVFSRQLTDSEQDFLYFIGPDGARRPLIPKGIDWFVLSPDGSRVLYADDDPGRPREIMPAIVNVDGSDPHVLRSRIPLYGLWPDDWSPDGARIVGSGGDPTRGGAINLYTVRASDGGDLVQVTSPPNRQDDNTIGYSPDGSKIMFLRPVHDVSGNSGGAVKDLLVVNTDGSGLTRLTPPGTVLGPFDSGVAGTPSSPMFDRWNASWSPDGSQVAFAAAAGTPGETRNGEVPRGLYVVDVDGTGAHQIVTGQIIDAQWSPDGNWIAFSMADPELPEVFIVHPDGTGLRALTSSSDGLGSWGPVWSPDSSALLFVRNGGSGQFDSDLWFAHVDGSDLTQLTHTPAEYFFYAWAAWPNTS